MKSRRERQRENEAYMNALKNSKNNEERKKARQVLLARTPSLQKFGAKKNEY